MPTKLIEVALPLDVINREAAREKSIRHGHPSTLHLWWSRKPLAACRAVLFAQLVDDPSAHADRFPTPEAQSVERQRLFRIIERLVPWEASIDETILEEARAEIRKCYPEGTPPIVDPFCGGGSIPLEAQRLGLEARASDLNPVAVLITKALIELPPKFANRPPVHPIDGGTFDGFGTWKRAAGLAEDVRWYGNWMREQAEQRIGHLYPKATLAGGSEATVIAWLWVRTVTCSNPGCGASTPLSTSFWLGKKKGKEVWINPIADRIDKRVHFEIGLGKAGPPVEGNVGRAGAICLVCDNLIPLDHIRNEGRAGRLGAQLMTIVAQGHRQRIYLPPNLSQAAAADVKLPDDIPDTDMPANPRWFSPPMYGMTHHADLFTDRQLVALCTFSDLVAEARAKVLTDSGGDKDYSDAIATYLAFALSKLADRHSTLTNWYASRESTSSTFARQALPMTWDYAETNPLLDGTGSFANAVAWTSDCLLFLASDAIGTAQQLSVLDVTFDGAVVSMDPPYYDNIGFADLSDYFYVWLRRSLQPIYPALFATLLTPKEEELVATPYRFGGSKRAAELHFESGFRAMFQQLRSVADGTPMTVFYAFKQKESDVAGDNTVQVASTGWEKMLDGLMSAGLAVTGTWPMRTEASNRMLSMGTNALASSIVLVCRPRQPDSGVTDRRSFQQSLRSRLASTLRDLQSGGVAPVDLAQAAIGPGMAVFSSYERVVEPDGSPMRVRTALALINQVLDEVAADQEGEFDEDTRWAIAWYAENGMDTGPFGRADDLSRAKNVSVEGLVRAGIVKSGAGNVRLLDRSELDPDWDPATDSRLTVWEIAQHLIRRLLDESEASAADLLGRVGGLGEAARDLAYRLFLIAESKKWSKEAGPYNALGAAWPELSRRAALGPSGQGRLM